MPAPFHRPPSPSTALTLEGSQVGAVGAPMYVYIYAYMCIYICSQTYLFIHLCKSICIYTNIYIYTYLTFHVHVYIHTAYLRTISMTRQTLPPSCGKQPSKAKHFFSKIRCYLMFSTISGGVHVEAQHQQQQKINIQT